VLFRGSLRQGGDHVAVVLDVLERDGAYLNTRVTGRHERTGLHLQRLVATVVDQSPVLKKLVLLQPPSDHYYIAMVDHRGLRRRIGRTGRQEEPRGSWAGLNACPISPSRQGCWAGLNACAMTINLYQPGVVGLNLNPSSSPTSLPDIRSHSIS